MLLLLQTRKKITFAAKSLSAKVDFWQLMICSYQTTDATVAP